MAGQLKHPATIIAGINSAVVAAGIYYVYQQINGIKNTVAEMERQIASLNLTLKTIKDQDGVKNALVRDTNEKVNSIDNRTAQEIEALNQYLAVMNNDLHGLTDQLNSTGIQVELISVASARASYQGEMHFPSPHQAHMMTPAPATLQLNGGYGTSPTAAGMRHHSHAMPANSAGPGVGAGASKVGVSASTAMAMPTSRPAQMRMGRAAMPMQSYGMGGGLMQTPQVKEPDPIGDLLDIAQTK